MDRASPAVAGDLGPCAPVALHSERRVVRPARRDLVVQHRPPAGPSADAYRARHRARRGVLARGGRPAMDRPAFAAAAARRAGLRSAGLADVAGPDSRSAFFCFSLTGTAGSSIDAAMRPGTPANGPFCARKIWIHDTLRGPAPCPLIALPPRHIP